MCSSRRMGKSTCQRVVSFIRIRRNHTRKIHTVELKSVITKCQRLEHRVLRNSRFCFADVQNNEIIYSDWKGKGVSMHSSVEACGWRWVAIFRPRKQRSYPMSMGLDVSLSGHFEVDKISCPLRELNHVARNLVSKLTVFCRLPLDWL